MKAYWNKEYRQKFDQLRKIIIDQSFCIVEIGSHYGEDSLRLSETFPNSKIYCFEPDPRNISVHRKHVDHPRIFLNECAVSSQEGVQPFYQSHSKNTSLLVPEKYGWISDSDYTSLDLHNSGASSLKSGYQHALQGTIEVPTLRLDSWCKTTNIASIDFAWIDVQGAERHVIEGMGEKIKIIKYIWMEYGEMFYDGAMSRDETVSLLESKGFSAVNNQQTNAQDLLFKRTS